MLKNLPRGSTALTNARRERIISACEKQYQTMSFKGITLRDIAGATSFTYTSIHNCFRTNEEFFLVLMQKEYECWAASLDALTNDDTTMSVETFVITLVCRLENRVVQPKLLSMTNDTALSC